jgi:hypothetical protein
MSQVWELPELMKIQPIGDESFIQLVCKLNEPSRVWLLMLLWRVWHVRNEVVQSKPAPPLDVSVRFLDSYLSLLQACKLIQMMIQSRERL